MPMPITPMQAPAITIETVQQQGDMPAQKNFLGEHLYIKVKEVDEAMAGRIVGMILDAFSIEQMVQHLQDDAALKETISRAI